MATPSTGEYLEGHADFSAYIAVDPDLQIFHRFTRLTARNLLYLQSELTSLETWFDEFDKEDEQQLRVASEAEKIDIWLQDALTKQHACLSLQEPGKGTLEALREWYSRKSPLLGRESETLDDGGDLVSLKGAGDPDRLSRMLRDNTGFLFSYFHKEAHGYPPSWGNVHVFREQLVERLVAITSVSLAALLLVGSIVALYFEQTPGVRLGLVGIFTFIFAASVGLLTSANRGDLFAATAGYAAVLVVFVSGNLGA